MSDGLRSPSPRSSEEPGVAAFFDMDRTLLRDSSGRLYLRYLRSQGRLTGRQWSRVAILVGWYVIGLLDFPRLMARIMAQVDGGREAAAWQLSAAWFTAMLEGSIAHDARVRVEWHCAQDHHVAVVSAATVYAVRPVAHALGLGDRYLATQLEVASGMFTGNVISPACYGQGKVLLTRRYATQHNLSLEQSYFYSDSDRDLPLLEAVGRPVAVNPNRKLAKIAVARGWPLMRFS